MIVMDELKAALRDRIADLAEIEPDEVLEEAPLQELGIDSLMAIELVVFVEKRTRCEFPEDCVGKIRTLGDILRELEPLLPSEAA